MNRTLAAFRARLMLMVAVAMAPLFAITVWAAVDERARAETRQRAHIRRWVLLLASGISVSSATRSSSCWC